MTLRLSGLALVNNGCNKLSVKAVVKTRYASTELVEVIQQDEVPYAYSSGSRWKTLSEKNETLYHNVDSI